MLSFLNGKSPFDEAEEKLEAGETFDKEIIHPEDRSCIQIENLRNVHELLGDGKRVALVTSDYNIERALGDCFHTGLRAYAVGAITPEGPYRNHMYAEEQFITENREKN